MAFSRSQVDKLGDRLRKSDTVSPEDLALLQQYIDAHADAQAHVVDTLRQGLDLHPGPLLSDSTVDFLDPELTATLRASEVTVPFAPDPTARLKTRDTTLEKLRRRPTRLSTIQDVAGCRIVLPSGRGRLTQQLTVAAVAKRFPGSKVLDRCATPSFGYRAVHVVVPIAGLNVEVQVRTSIQNRWAQTFEALADRIGRQIRYGEAPDEADRPVLPSEDTSRRWMTDKLLALGDSTAALEEELLLYHEPLLWLRQIWNEVISTTGGPSADQVPVLLRAAKFDQKVSDVQRSVETILEELQQAFEEQGGS